MRLFLLIIPFMLLSPKKDLNCLNCSDNNKFSVLVITETKGFEHKSINAGLDLIKSTKTIFEKLFAVVVIYSS